jgi:hypothetical protein
MVSNVAAAAAAADAASNPAVCDSPFSKCGSMQVTALLPGAKLKMAHFGERYCQGGTKWDKFAGGFVSQKATQHNIVRCV